MKKEKHTKRKMRMYAMQDSMLASIRLTVFRTTLPQRVYTTK